MTRRVFLILLALAMPAMAQLTTREDRLKAKMPYMPSAIEIGGHILTDSSGNAITINIK